LDALTDRELIARTVTHTCTYSRAKGLRSRKLVFFKSLLVSISR